MLSIRRLRNRKWIKFDSLLEIVLKRRFLYTPRDGRD